MRQTISYTLDALHDTAADITWSYYRGLWFDG